MSDLEDRYIAIVGESWAEMLGTERAKYLTPKVGIFLHRENSDLSEAKNRMQVISGNAEMAMVPLQQILAVIAHRFKESAKYNPKYQKAQTSIELAIEHVKQADRLLNHPHAQPGEKKS